MYTLQFTQGVFDVQAHMLTLNDSFDYLKKDYLINANPMGWQSSLVPLIKAQ